MKFDSHMASYDVYYIVASAVIGFSIATLFVWNYFKTKYGDRVNQAINYAAAEDADSVSPDDPRSCPMGTVFGDPPSAFFRLSERMSEEGQNNNAFDEEDQENQAIDDTRPLNGRPLLEYEKEMAEQLSEEEKQAEAEVRRKQLESIFSLMAEKEEFGVSTVDELKSQMGLYSAKF